MTTRILFQLIEQLDLMQHTLEKVGTQIIEAPTTDTEALRARLSERFTSLMTFMKKEHLQEMESHELKAQVDLFTRQLSEDKIFMEDPT